MDMDKIGLKTQRSYKAESPVHQLWRATEYTVHQEHRANRERYVEHTLHKQREKTMAHLLKIQTCAKGHKKCYQQQPHGVALNLITRLDQGSTVDAYEKYWHSAPKYLQMSHCMMYGQHPLHHDTPYYHQQWQPTIYGMTLYQPHIEAEPGSRKPGFKRHRPKGPCRHRRR